MQFDPNAFMNVEIDQPLVRRPPLLPGDYVATIGAVKAESWQSQKDPSNPKSGMRYVVPLTLEVPQEVQNKLGTPEDPYPVTVKLTDTIMLDLTDGGTLDLSVGKNGGLRRWREALDMNKKGETFSPRKMEGRMVLVKVSHEIYNGEVMERVGGIARV
jgi:hypothetical protein